jgi:CPA1 family monovalent cation:H+ antiporter
MEKTNRLVSFGLVFATSLIVAYLSQAIIPGFTLALGFLLGGIVSPPDAVAATSVLKGLPVPKEFSAFWKVKVLLMMHHH